MILVFQDNILFPSYQTMDTIILTFGDFDVDTMASATNTKVNTSFIDNCINRNKFPILGEYASQRSRALSAKTLHKTLATVNNTAQGKRFYSKRQVPGSSGVDLFKQTLDPRESHYCFPPPYLLVDALQHFKIQQVSTRNTWNT